MKKFVIVFLIIPLLLSCNSQETKSPKDFTRDESAINQSIQDWDNAWGNKNVELAIKHYSNKTDWTNAFGRRVQSKDELKDLLKFIFNMDFVMDGENNYGKNEITFLNDSTATVRSKNIRINQRWPDGSRMDDRHINHLRIYQNINGNWLITNHMISQAWPHKNPE